VLMKISDFTSKQKSEIYELINSEINKQAMSSINTYNSNVYLYEIRDNLLNSREKPYVTFEIYAELQGSSKLFVLIDSIESMASSFGARSSHYIEFRHNSPYQFLLVFFSDAQNIATLIAMFYLAYKCYDKFHNDLLDRKQKQLNIEKTDEEIKQIRIKNSKHDSHEPQPNYEVLSEQAKMHLNDFAENGIIVGIINHNVYNVNINNYGDNFQEFSLK
jgi:hypothetical protein